MIYRVTHRTIYRYAGTASFSQNEACLRPRDTARQTCLEWELSFSPEASFHAERDDAFGNRIQYLEFTVPHRSLEVCARSLVRTTAPPPLENTVPWEAVRKRLEEAPSSSREAQPFRWPTPMTPNLPALADLCSGLFPEGRPLAEAALALSGRIHAEFCYDPAATTVSTPLTRVLEDRRGVCQDFAHLLVAALRRLGLAARYVSGYLETLPPPGMARLTGADASHAWASVWCPPVGWIGLDPTNDCRTGERHIITAWGRDYADVTPWKGLVLGGGSQSITVSVDTEPQPPNLISDTA